jgi:DNA-binding Lrp family transcriptional regulator
MTEGKGNLNDREFELIAELMKNSRRSDRELAKAIGTSQPTVSRMIKKLEGQGIIKEYTMIPDFSKLGYKIMAITFGLSRALDKETAERTRKALTDSVKDKHFEFMMLERGRGLGYDGVIISLHEDYTSYLDVLKWLRQLDFLDVRQIDSFIICLDDEVRYRPLTVSILARLLRRKRRKVLTHE